MDFETMRNLPEGWSLPIVAKTRKPTSKFHYFVGQRSVCEKWARPEYAHPVPPELRDGCIKCFGHWAKLYGTATQLAEWRYAAKEPDPDAVKAAAK